MAVDKEIILQIVKQICPEVGTYEHRNQLTLIITKDKVVEAAKALRDDPRTGFDMLTDITAIDWLNAESRFEVVYFLYSNKHRSRLRLKVRVSGAEPTCPTMVDVWESANWYERETFDMYGIVFEGHPDLRRFYMPEDYVDPVTKEPLYPLRKDFPLMGVADSLPLPPYPEKYGELK